MIRRTLLLKTKPDLDAQGVAKLVDVLRKSRDEIPGVVSNSVERNLCRSEHSPWTHAWDFTLRDVEVVKTYRPHPYHENVIKPITAISNEPVTTYIYFNPVRHRSDGVPSPYKHSVLLDFDPQVTEDQIARLDARFLDLVGDAPGKHNWGIGRRIESVPGSSWARIWEFEFGRAEDFESYWQPEMIAHLLPGLNPLAGPVTAFTEVQVRLEQPVINYTGWE